jgi:hypothetical protein
MMRMMLTVTPRQLTVTRANRSEGGDAKPRACRLCQDWSNRVNRASSSVSLTDASNMKQALAHGGPYEASTLVHEDILDCSGGIYRTPLATFGEPTR